MKEKKGGTATAVQNDRPLGNKDVYPSDDVVFSVIGKAQPRWVEFFTLLAEAYPDIVTEWRYYNDGQSWLMKGVGKKKTVFWLSVHSGHFTLSSYFTEKSASLASQNTETAELLEQFKGGKDIGKLRPVTIRIGLKKDVKAAIELIGLKLAAK